MDWIRNMLKSWKNTMICPLSKTLPQRWLTEQTNRTEHFRGRVRFVRVRRHIEQNRTIPLFGSCSAGFRTLIPVFGSVRLELEPNSTLVRFVFGKFELLKAKPSTLYSLASELWIAGVIPGLGSQNNGRGTMAEEQWPRNNGRGTIVGRTMASLGSTNTAKSELSRIPWFSLKSEKPKTSHFLVILTHGRTIV